jgi:ABC-type Fe3+/spermidine/putrescine transport system ATPase subunit
VLRATIGLALGDLDVDVDLAVADREVVALLGPNGAGKTTVLRAIAGLEPLDRGRVEVDGQVLDDPATGAFVPTAERPIGVVFQDYLLFPRMSALENVAFGLRARGVPKAQARARAEGWLERVDLADHAAARPRALSGGQAQRVALARALATEPRVLLLDEPLAALDRQLRETTRIELMRLQEQLGITFVMVTHDQQEALSMSTRIALMRDGRIEQVGTPAEVYSRPASVFAAEFLGGANLIMGRVIGYGSGRLSIECDGGVPLEAPAREGTAPGDRVALMLRPESLRVAAAGDAGMPVGGPVLAGTIERVIFEGNALLVRVRTSAAPVITARIAAPVPSNALAVGASVCVSWPFDAAVVLPAR